MNIFRFKHSRTIYGTISLLLGAGFFVIPMLPIGYIFLFAGSLLLAPRIPLFQKFMTWLKKKDKKGRLEKVEQNVDNFFGTPKKSPVKFK